MSPTNPNETRNGMAARDKRVVYTQSFPLLDYAAARSAGEIAATACGDAAERRGFNLESARAFVLGYLEAHGPTPGEVLVNAAKAAQHVPHDDRAFGAVFGALKRRGKIECVGTVARTRGHGTAGGRVWRAA